MPDADLSDSDAPVQLSISVKDWQWLDATIDNAVAMASVAGDEDAVEQGRRIRTAGWEAARVHPRNKDGWAGWPPVDDDLTVSLSPAAWYFAIQELRRWDQVARKTSSSEAEQAELRGLAIASFLAERVQFR